MYKFVTMTVLLASVVCLAADPIPFQYLQIWLQADSVGSNTDFFLPSMRNMSNRRFAVNQVDLAYRPLYIRDFIQHRPAITMSDSRGFAFGAMRATTETKVYVGYYHEVADRPAEFRIETFGPDDILAQNAKNGFAIGIYDGMLGFHGQPGYSSAFAEFIMYEITPTDEQDRQIRSYLMGRYGLCFDSRYLRNNPAILIGNALCISNIVRLKNNTMVCAAGIKQTEKRKEIATLDLIRSYNYGEKWSQTIGQILSADEYPLASMPYLYDASSQVLYCFYSEKQPDGQYKAAFKYSVDDGYNWSKTAYIESLISKEPIRIAGSANIDGQAFFCISSKLKPPTLLASNNIDKEQEPKNLVWKVLAKLSDVLNADNKAVFDSVSLVPYQKRLCCIFNSTDGFIYQTFSADGGTIWSQAQKSAAIDGSELRNPGSLRPFPFISDDKLMMCFRNSPKAALPQCDTIWITEAVVDKDVLRWSQPRVCLYSKEYSTEAAMQISYAAISAAGLANVAVLSGDSAYFSMADMNADVLPVGVGEFELKDGPSQEEYYTIPAVPSLADGRVIINIDMASGVSQSDALLMRIGEDKNKIVLFTEKGRFGLYITDGYQSAVVKSCRYDQKTVNSVTVDIDGRSDIMRILVDGVSAGWDETDGSAWVYFSPEIGIVTADEKLFIPKSSHGYIKKLSLYYPKLPR